MSLLSLYFLSQLCVGAEKPGDEQPIARIAFVSCFKETRKAPALQTIVEWKPDVFIWMGDNIYGDSEDMSVLRAKYQKAAANQDYQEIVEKAQVIGTWDDHDFGKNDAGKEFGPKAASQKEFLDFLAVPTDSPRREREGVYALHDFGPTDQQVRFLLLDTRYHRDALGSDGTILGEEQWKWLRKSLRESRAAVNIIVSSIQVLPQEHRFEKWANFPQEKARLMSLLAEEGVPPVLLLSGDRHLAEITLEPKAVGYPLYEVTSSSLNSSFGGSPKEKNSLRIGQNYGRNNFGTLTLQWKGDFPGITLEIRDENGGIQRKQEIVLQKKK